MHTWLTESNFHIRFLVFCTNNYKNDNPNYAYKYIFIIDFYTEYTKNILLT